MVIQRVFCGYPMMRVLLAIGIDRVILNACLAQGFDAFLTCATLTAMVSIHNTTSIRTYTIPNPIMNTIYVKI